MSGPATPDPASGQVLDHEGVPITDLVADEARYRVAVAASRRNGLDPATLSRADLEFLMPPPVDRKITDMTDDEARARALGALRIVKPDAMVPPPYLGERAARARPVSRVDPRVEATVAQLDAAEQAFRKRVARNPDLLRDADR